MIVKDFALTDNFQLKEVVCKCGKCENVINPHAVQMLQKLREVLGVPVYVVSGYRCEVYNKKCGGAPKSQHKLGKAWDIKVKGMSPREVALVAEKVGFKGIGIYSTFTHVDVRNVRTYWVQDVKGNVKSVSKL